jgi:hypothetical protein
VGKKKKKKKKKKMSVSLDNNNILHDDDIVKCGVLVKRGKWSGFFASFCRTLACSFCAAGDHGSEAACFDGGWVQRFWVLTRSTGMLEYWKTEEDVIKVCVSCMMFVLCFLLHWTVVCIVGSVWLWNNPTFST